MNSLSLIERGQVLVMQYYRVFVDNLVIVFLYMLSAFEDIAVRSIESQTQIHILLSQV